MYFTFTQEIHNKSKNFQSIYLKPFSTRNQLPVAYRFVDTTVCACTSMMPVEFCVFEGCSSTIRYFISNYTNKFVIMTKLFTRK